MFSSGAAAASGDESLGPPTRAPVTFGDSQKSLPDPIRDRELALLRPDVLELAPRWRLGAWFGFSHAEMEDLNRAGSVLLADWQSTAAGSVGRLSEAHGALEFGGELGFRVISRFGVALRLGGQIGAESLVRFSARDPSLGTVGGSRSVRTAVYPVLFGIWGESGNLAGFHTRASLFAGPAYVSGECQARGVLPGWQGWLQPGESVPALLAQRRNVNYTALTSGSGLAVDNSIEIGMPVSRELTWFMEFGYRWAVVEEMSLDGDVDLDGDETIDIREGAILSHSDGSPVRFNYGGMRFFTGLRVAL